MFVCLVLYKIKAITNGIVKAKKLQKLVGMGQAFKGCSGTHHLKKDPVTE